MRSFGRKLAKGIRRSMPLWLYPTLIRRDVVGVFYHSVSDERLSHIQHLYPTEPVARFEAALRYIKGHFHPVAETELEAHRLQGRPLPRRALHLSFDDGFAECYSVARPLLLTYGIPCTFFVTTDWVDNQRMFYRNKVSLCIERMAELAHDAAKMVFTSLNNALDTKLTDAGDFARWIKSMQPGDEAVIDMTAKMLGLDLSHYLQTRQPYLTRQQILELHKDGFTIGAHTRSHTKLALLPPDQVEAEIVEPAHFVQQLTGSEQVPFSFPYSASGTDRALLAWIRAKHPFLGLFYDTRDLRQDESFIVNRIWAEKSAYRQAGRHTNLPALLHAAYRAEAYAAMRRWRSGAGDEEELLEEPG
ncbi:MAG: polysaccharide deacetylase family protein [Anaerolineales bacterium]